MVSRFRNNQPLFDGMQQFIGGAIWHEDLNALDAVAKGRPASVLVKGVETSVFLGSLSTSSGPVSTTVNAIEAEAIAHVANAHVEQSSLVMSSDVGSSDLNA